MFAVHVGPDAYRGGAGYLLMAAQARSSALFVVIAGFSLTLARERTHLPQALVLRRTAVRCAFLLVLGLCLASLEPGFLVILSFYALYFLAAEPFIRLRTPALAAAAAISVAAGPVLSYLLAPLLGLHGADHGQAPCLADLTSWTGLGRILDQLLLSGAYPALTYLPYLLAGLALGRLAKNTRPPAHYWLITAAGTAAAIAAYTTAWLATERWGGRQRLLAAIAAHYPQALATPDPIHAVLNAQDGTIPSTSWHWLLIADPYSQTPLEVLANTAIACALIALATATARNSAAAHLLRPPAAVGAMALSVYVAHGLVLALAFDVDDQGGSWSLLGWFTAAALVGAGAWRYLWQGSPLRRGPVEWALHTAVRRLCPPGYVEAVGPRYPSAGKRAGA
jgi:uncharacterized membrane protein YeiB